MSDQATAQAVRTEVTVEASAERAFAVFTEELDSWWPRESHHIGEEPLAAAVMEPFAGGRWFERGTGGAECEWGRILAWEPPERVLLAWHLNADWQYDPDPDLATEVEVRFIPEGAGRTRVVLEHRGFERLGDRAAEVRTAVGSEQGWTGLMKRYAEAAGAEA